MVKSLGIKWWIGIVALAVGVGLAANPKAGVSGTCPPVANTPLFTIVYGSVTLNGNSAPAGTVVQAVNPRGDTVGCYVVGAGSAGQYGAMYVYGEDTSVNPVVPGMREGETIAFQVNGAVAVATPVLSWTNDRDLHQVNLSASQQATNTPTSTSTNTPLSTLTNTPTSTNTNTPTQTGTATSTPTNTLTPTGTSTATSTKTPTSTNTSNASSTSTLTSTVTRTPTVTSTVIGSSCYDPNHNLHTDVADLQAIAAHLQSTTPSDISLYDLNHNNVVDVEDLRTAIAQWKQVCP